MPINQLNRCCPHAWRVLMGSLWDDGNGRTMPDAPHLLPGADPVEWCQFRTGTYDEVDRFLLDMECIGGE